MIVVVDEVGQVKLGGALLPGIYQSIEVTGELKIDQPQVEGRSSSPKQILGFEDPTIVLSVVLATDDESSAYEKLQTVANMFRTVDKQAKPYVYRIVSKHLDAWGIDEVIFKGLRTKDDNTKDVVLAQLDFIEYEAPVVKQETAAVKTQQPAGSAPSAAATSYLDTVAKAQSPARDDAPLPDWRSVHA